MKHGGVWGDSEKVDSELLLGLLGVSIVGGSISQDGGRDSRDHWMLRLSEGIVLSGVREFDEEWLERDDEECFGPRWVCEVWREYGGLSVELAGLREAIRRWWS